MGGKRKRPGGTMETRATKCRTLQLLHELQINELGASAKIIDAPRQQDDVYVEIMPDLPLDKLPEDILRHICSLMPFNDAARAACVSHGFLCCWRHYPILIVNSETLGLIKRKLSLDADEVPLYESAFKGNDKDSHAVMKMNHIIKNHSGVGVKVLKLQLSSCPNISGAFLDRWLETVIKPGIKKLSLQMSSCRKRTVYNFPSSVLSNKAGGGTMQSLFLYSCGFHPTVTLGCTSLTSLYLCEVRIHGEELGQFLSNSFALERLVISDCNDIIHFKVPCLMQQLKYLEVTKCQMLQVIEIDAPKLSTFIYGDVTVQVSLGDPLQVKDVRLMGYNQPNTVCYARTELPSITPNVESLIVSSSTAEMISTPMVPIKFLHLKFLEIYRSELLALLPSYDFFSLVSFLDASPAMETFILHVEQRCLRRDSILDGGHTDLRRILHRRHDKLQNVTITGFNSTKSMIELTIHIVENAPSLKCITLDTLNFYDKDLLTMGECLPMMRGGILEARKALDAAKRYIVGKGSRSSDVASEGRRALLVRPFCIGRTKRASRLNRL